MTRCSATASLLEAFSDGELPPEKVVEVERHVVDCPTCGARVGFSRALRFSTRRAVGSAAHPAEAFRNRLARALEAERERSAYTEPPPRRIQSPKILPWRAILPLAAAAAAMVTWGAWRSTSLTPPHYEAKQAGSSWDTVLGSAASVDQLIDQLVEYHAEARAPEITEPSMVSMLEPEVGLPVRVPKLQDYGALWQGGSVVPMRHSSRAASLRYMLGDHRITIYVYDSSQFPLRARLEPRVVGNVPVYVGTRRGYSIAATEHRGVGYALASDLPDPESAELVAATVTH